MQKSAHYRRAVWLAEAGRTLSQVLEECFEELDENEILKFPQGEDLECVIARRIIQGGRVFLHFVTFEEGAPVAVIQAAVEADELETDVADPPPGQEYVRTQLFCLIRGNDVVWTTHNAAIREGPINALFHGLVHSRLGEGDHAQFELQAVLDRDAFSDLFDAGISEIDLGIGDFRPTLEALVQGRRIPGMNMLRALVESDPTPEEIEAASNVFGKIVLQPGRRWDKPHVRDLLAGMAGSLVESGQDEFVIVTKSGLRLTAEKMRLHQSYDAEGNKQVLNTEDVYRSLRRIMTEWDRSGVLSDD